MELSFLQRVAVVFIAMASSGFPLSPAVGAASETTDRQGISSPTAGITAGEQLADGIGLRPASEIGEPFSGAPRRAEKKRETTRQKGELLILMLQILRGPK